MHDLTLARLRPRGHAPADIREALTALQQERDACQQRADAAHRDRTAALVAGTGWRVREADAVLKAAGEDLEMLGAMEPALRDRMTAAEAVEARAHALVAAANTEAAAAVQAFRAALPKYARLAEAVAEIARLADAAGHATQYAASLARSYGVSAPQLDMPGAVTNTPTGFDVPFAALVRLPAPDGRGLLCGTWGTEFQHRSIYAPPNAGAGGR